MEVTWAADLEPPFSVWAILVACCISLSLLVYSAARLSICTTKVSVLGCAFIFRISDGARYASMCQSMTPSQASCKLARLIKMTSASTVKAFARSVCEAIVIQFANAVTRCLNMSGVLRLKGSIAGLLRPVVNIHVFSWFSRWTCFFYFLAIAAIRF